MGSDPPQRPDTTDFVLRAKKAGPDDLRPERGAHAAMMERLRKDAQEQRLVIQAQRIKAEVEAADEAEDGG